MAESVADINITEDGKVTKRILQEGAGHEFPQKNQEVSGKRT